MTAQTIVQPTGIGFAGLLTVLFIALKQNESTNMSSMYRKREDRI